MKRLCVYCGSSPGNDPKFVKAAQSLGRRLAANHIELVYGGADIGVMGAIANSVLANGGKVTGVIPKALCVTEVAHQSLTTLEVVEDMHERKARMSSLSDGFITLPGGLGTLEELFEMLTWSQLGFHRKPIGLMNIDGYFDGLLEFLDNSVRAGFVKEIHQSLLLVGNDPEELLSSMASYQSPIIDKWRSTDQAI